MTESKKEKQNEVNSFQEELNKLPEELQTKFKKYESIFKEISDIVEKKAEDHSIGFYVTPMFEMTQQGPKPNFDKLTLNFLLDDFERPIPEFNPRVLLGEEFDKILIEKKVKDKDGDEILEYYSKSDNNLKFAGTSISELRENCFDAVYEDLQKLGSSIIYKDNRGFIGALKSIEIHRNLLLQKFEKYIVAYVGAGSWLRGEKSNDFDVFIVVDDTDVKRMPRLQVRDQLMKIAWQMAQEVGQLTGITVHCQVYLLTDFWDALKDAHPVMFTFLRDGVPFYDRGIYSAWKELLKLGKIRPSQEAIDMHMGVGSQLIDRAKNMFREIFMNDIYYSILNPSQALLMLKGYNPTTPKETVKMFKEVLLAKEKCITQTESDILEDVVMTFKKLEHNDDKSFILKGGDIDKHLKNNEKFLKKIKKLFEEITEEKTKESISNSYNEMLSQIRNIEGFSDLDEKSLIKKFEDEIIKKNKVASFVKKSLKSILKAVKDFESGKLNTTEIYKVQKEMNLVTGEIKDYIHRNMMTDISKRRFSFTYNDGKIGEIICYDNIYYLIALDENKGFKFDKKTEEFDLGQNHFTDDKKYSQVKINSELFNKIKEVLKTEEILL